MARSLGTFARSALRRVFGKTKKTGNRIKALYEERSYLEAYAKHTDLRVDEDPHAAVGGLWEEIGKLQFDFLVKNGLRPEHKMLDIGCGTLRGGRHFINHLVSGNYSGIDISPNAIEYGMRLVKEEGLSHKRPTLVVSQHKDLKFREFTGQSFDFILAQSVFTHLMPDHIEECFQNIGRVMNPKCLFFFTFIRSDEFKQAGLKNFCYPFSFFEKLAHRHGFNVKDRSREYPHPRKQQMGVLTKKAG